MESGEWRKERKAGASLSVLLSFYPLLSTFCFLLPMRIEERQLKAFIADSGLVSRSDLDAAQDEATKRKRSLGDVLISGGKLSEDDLRRMQAYILGIPFVNLKGVKIDAETLSLIPEPVARSHNIITFRKIPEGLEVAMLDTDDLEAIDFVKKKVGLRILPRLTDRDSIKDALLQYQKSLRAEFGDLIKKESDALLSSDIAPALSAAGDASPESLKKLAEDLPVVRIVDTLLKHAVIQSASDIHIEPLEKELLVRYRIDGILHDAMVLPKVAHASISARIKVLAGLKLDEKRLPQDGRFKVDVTGESVSFRVSVLPTYFGEKTVMRLLKDHSAGFSLEALGFHGAALEIIHQTLKRTTGMLLTTGPTGSGKTTTLYTLLDILNTPQVNISTVEDPIEYQMPRINQMQVRPDIGLTFASGLRSLVRQDPDIIMVGEIRDTETASLAINAALTGHFVLSTLHTNSAAGAVPRLIDMHAEPFLIVSTVNAIIAQRLVRKLTDAKKKYFPKDKELAALGTHVDLAKVLALLKEERIVLPSASWGDIPFYQPEKSADSEDGYRGRLGIYEVMPVSSAIKELILSGASVEGLEEQAKKEGMMSMIEDGVFKAAQGVTTIEEVLRVITE